MTPSIASFGRELVIACLIHLIEVIKPAEGLGANRALLTLSHTVGLKTGLLPLSIR
jgi:hypothetical protein